MVSFRLSPEEYRLFQEACVIQGVPNISELARRALYRILSDTTAPSQRPVSQQFFNLSLRLHALLEEVDRIGTAIGEVNLNGHTPPDGPGNETGG